MVKIIKVENDLFDAFLPLLPEQLQGVAHKLLLLGAVSEDYEPVGLLACQMYDMTFYVEYIYVIRGRRCQGVANSLIDTLVGIVRNGLYQWDIVFEMSIEAFHMPLIELLASREDFDLEDGASLYRVSGRDLASIPRIKLLRRSKERMRSLAEVSPEELKVLKRAQKLSGDDYFREINLEDLDKRLSCINLRRGRIGSCMLVLKDGGDGVMRIAYMYVTDEDSSSVVKMFSTVVKCRDKYRPDSDVEFVLTNHKLKDTVFALFDGKIIKLHLTKAIYNWR